MLAALSTAEPARYQLQRHILEKIVLLPWLLLLGVVSQTQCNTCETLTVFCRLAVRSAFFKRRSFD
jgi:hypothetical protein